MPVHNADIAAIFEEIADLLEIDAHKTRRGSAIPNCAIASRTTSSLRPSGG